MTLVIHAPNVHQGGGRALLVPLLMAAGRQSCVVQVDSRLQLPDDLPHGLTLVRVPPTIAGRLAAEWRLRRLARLGDDLLCFGNLPPLLPNAARVRVFLQNRYLLSRRGLDSLPWRVRLRIVLERQWLRRCLGGAELVVQTASMARETLDALGVAARLLPFAADGSKQSMEKPVEDENGLAASAVHRFDFVYVASGEPHKNHRALIAAWCLLASDGIRPSLCLTLDPAREKSLLEWIHARQNQNHLDIHNSGVLPNSSIPHLYARSGALIYPSLFESFGLPLVEASRAGLPVLAPELDYVRDVVEPAQTFDAASSVSIARAVKRFLLVPEPALQLRSPQDFLRQLLDTASE